MNEGEEPNASGDTVSVSDAARELGITLPRLLRLLHRPEFAAHVRKGERQTRTGTRTVTLVSVTVLPMLRKAAEERKHEQDGANRSRSEGEASSALAQVVLAGMQARLDDKDREIERLARLLDDAHARERLTLEALAREQTLRAIAAAPPEAALDVPSASETGQGAEQAQTDAPGPQEAQQRPRQSWWPWRRKAEK